VGGLSGRHRQVLVFCLMVVGVVIALLCVNAEAELVRRRDASCDASLVLPASVSVLGVIGVLVGLAAITLLGRWFGRDRRAIVTVLFVTALAALVFELFALVTVFQDPAAPNCGSSGNYSSPGAS
jgi:drug/metabolite transporter (DMT)-like permease